MSFVQGCPLFRGNVLLWGSFEKSVLFQRVLLWKLGSIVCLAPFPSLFSLFQMQPVKEIDGSTSPDIFTVLSLGVCVCVCVGGDQGEREGRGRKESDQTQYSIEVVTISYFSVCP